ncbi:MAG TPA: metal-sulfur cluster assembly factor [Chloroflexia bacterium]|nr:metal-sulfur cluster assembly factor [Chloroflexia bacterium]
MSTVMTTNEDQVRDALREVYDPELGINIVDLGLIYEIKLAEARCDLTCTLTSPGCPLGPEIVANIRRALSQFEDVEDVQVHIVFSPPWHPAMMSDDAKDELGYFG